MSRTHVKKKFKIKKINKKGICRIIDNDRKCNKAIHCRGLCATHHTHFRRWKLLEKYGAKSKFVYVSQSKYKVNKKAKPNKCRIIENGKACTRSVHGRRLCARHWLIFNRHGLLKKYGTESRKDPRTFFVKKKIIKGICRINENNKPCKTKSISRGLCAKHYLRFLRDGRIKKYGK